MVNIKKMHVRQPASVLSKEVGKPLKIHLGSREATIFTKSTEYGKFIDNGYNDYIKTEDLKRVARQAFAEHFNIASEVSSVSGDLFQDAVPDPEEETAQHQATRENIEEIQQEASRRQAERRQRTAEEMDNMLEETKTFFEQHSSREKRNSSKGNITGGERASKYQTVEEVEAPKKKEKKKRLSAKQQAQIANNKRREREAKEEDKIPVYPQPEEAQGELPQTKSTKGTASSSSGYAQVQPEQTFTFKGFRIVTPSKVTVGIMRDTLEEVFKSQSFDATDADIYGIIRGENGKFGYLAKGAGAEKLRAKEELKRLYRRYVWSNRAKA